LTENLTIACFQEVSQSQVFSFNRIMATKWLRKDECDRGLFAFDLTDAPIADPPPPPGGVLSTVLAIPGCKAVTGTPAVAPPIGSRFACVA
jgi:hypothetical protein